MRLGDNQLPSCSRCTLLNRECVRVASDPFRHAYNPTVKPVDRALGPRPEYEYAEDQVWLTPRSNALLLRHFVAKLSLWFDYCDPRNTFATSVVQQAVNSPTLLYAILATSARHLSMTSDFDAYLADKYHRECLALLINIVGDNSALLDEALCAATVILRLFEEISVPLVGSDTQGHLMGTHTFMRASEYQPSGIREAAFRVVLRQEIVFAFKTQTPLQLLPEYVQVDRAMDTADDWGSAFHIMVLCAEVLSYCYGEEQKLAETWDNLSERVSSWMESKSASFEPLFSVPAGVKENQVFPQIWLLNDCHVAAHQHYLMCQILLVSHDPRRPQLGPKRTEAVESSERVIRDHVKDICGIALSNNHCIPAMFTASMVISVCGEFFRDYQDQKSMMEILVKTDVELAWPTASAQTYLLEKWNWNHA
ncbi:hypothetical protein BGZ60DRAFT_473863 [Tricladium varicosporioides]|nr:hypothetical protein BGZ60DRAFT_473863 [Hymenoscyphus varicosporioides]